MRHAILILAACSIILPAASAQCAPVTVTPYGNSCGNGFPGAQLVALFDPVGCVVTVEVNAFPGCCNSFLTSKIYAFGLQQIQAQVPGIPGPCFLLTTPDFVVTTTGSAPGITIPVLPQLQGLTIYAQGAAIYFTTIGLTTEVTLTQGLQIDF